MTPDALPSQPTGIGRTTLMGPSSRAMERPLSFSHSTGGAVPALMAAASAFASSNVNLPAQYHRRMPHSQSARLTFISIY